MVYATGAASCLRVGVTRKRRVVALSSAHARFFVGRWAQHDVGDPPPLRRRNNRQTLQLSRARRTGGTCLIAAGSCYPWRAMFPGLLGCIYCGARPGADSVGGQRAGSVFKPATEPSTSFPPCQSARTCSPTKRNATHALRHYSRSDFRACSWHFQCEI